VKVVHRYDDGVARYTIRTYGDPVLRQRAPEVTEIDGHLQTLVDDMVATMYEAPGVGLAAPQVGVQKRLFVYDLHDEKGPRSVVNPKVSEARGEWTYEEGCLSVPGLSWPIVRPKEVHLTGIDLDGNEVSIEADEFEARVYLHELDHLDGVLLIDRLDAGACAGPPVCRYRRRSEREECRCVDCRGPPRPLSPRAASGQPSRKTATPGRFRDVLSVKQGSAGPPEMS
jgi:peptide deformylase